MPPITPETTVFAAQWSQNCIATSCSGVGNATCWYSFCGSLGSPAPAPAAAPGGPSAPPAAKPRVPGPPGAPEPGPAPPLPPSPSPMGRRCGLPGPGEAAPQPPFVGVASGAKRRRRRRKNGDGGSEPGPAPTAREHNIPQAEKSGPAHHQLPYLAEPACVAAAQIKIEITALPSGSTPTRSCRTPTTPSRNIAKVTYNMMVAKVPCHPDLAEAARVRLGVELPNAVVPQGKVGAT